MYVAHISTGWSKHYVYIGRPTVQRKGSALANPFRLSSTTKEGIAANLQQYRRWLHTRLQAGDAAVWQALRDLRPSSVLVDYTQPRASHGHVIMRAWEWGVRQGLINPAPYANQAREVIVPLPEKRDPKVTDPAPPVVIEAPVPATGRRLTKNERRTVKTKRARDLAQARAYRGVAPRLEDPITAAEEEAERARLAQIDAALDTAFAARYITAAVA